jgi:hypothetical protein
VVARDDVEDVLDRPRLVDDRREHGGPVVARDLAAKRAGRDPHEAGGGLAGTVEGTVSSLGLLYTVLSSGEDAIMISDGRNLASEVLEAIAPYTARRSREAAVARDDDGGG